MATSVPLTSPGKATARRKGRANKMRLKLQEALAVAADQGLLTGGRTLTLRGRMPASLVAEAKRKSGIDSDSKLIEAALASLAVEDNYGEWLISQRGTVDPDLDLDF